MLSIAVCDDDPEMAGRLEKIIRDFFQEKNSLIQLKIFSDGKELLNSENIFNLIFLDIEMKEISGIEVGKRLRKQDVDVLMIYVTSHSGYWRSAYRVHAFEFLEKPVEKKRMEEILSDAVKQLNHKTNKMIKLKTEDGIVFQDVQEIYYFLLRNKRTVLASTKQGEFLVRENLSEIYKKLDNKQFIMAHRSDIVNLAYVYHVKGYDIYMKNGDWLPLAQKKRSEFLLKINEFFLR